jgi:hypothetical protein
MPHRVLSFDAGITHVGLVAAQVSDDWTAIEVTHAACIDLTDVRHDRVPRRQCKLPHTNSLAHRYAHFVQEMEPLICEATHFFVEQQPPQSAGMVFEQLLLFHFQGLTTSVSPARIHARFGLPRGDYERRKAASCDVAVCLFPALAPFMASASRGHDIADAACILQYQCEQRHRTWRWRQARSELNIERFAYRPAFCRTCAREGDAGQSAYRADDCPRCRPSGDALLPR